jgi:hypothetical protein
MAKKNAPKTVRIRITPLALLEERLAAAHLATTDFEDAQELRWSVLTKGNI